MPQTGNWPPHALTSPWPIGLYKVKTDHSLPRTMAQDDAHQLGTPQIPERMNKNAHGIGVIYKRFSVFGEDGGHKRM